VAGGPYSAVSEMWHSYRWAKCGNGQNVGMGKMWRCAKCGRLAEYGSRRNMADVQNVAVGEMWLMGKMWQWAKCG